MMLLLLTQMDAQKRPKYNDGPYIGSNGESARIMWIQEGAKHDTVVAITDNYVFEKDQLPRVEIGDLDFEEDEFQRYENVSKFVAISDIHGQYDLFQVLMKSHNVIDDEDNWIYGDGHLVVVGDVFDRGDQVTETLWALFRLEKQAKAAGGKVHLLLGNHELMILHGDIRYIHPKYRFTTGSFGIEYPKLYDQQTVLGRWLRSKNISTVINGIGFVHGGYSQEVINKESSLQKLNNTFKEQVMNNEDLDDEDDDLLSMLYFENGPLWYRGYANPDGFDLDQAKAILDTLKLKSIVVGHTSMPRIVSVHDGRIILIDSSIKFGKSGEILVYERDSLYRGMLSGRTAALDTKDENRSPFNYVHDFEDGELTIMLDTDIGELIKNKNDEEYQETKLTAIHDNEFNRTWDVRIRARGNMRKKVCHLPPLKIDFPKKTLNYLGFTNHDKLKVVLPCNDGKEYQQGLYKEYVVYQLYKAIDSFGFDTRLVNFILADNGKKKFDLTGFIIEDDKDYALRTNAVLVKDGIVNDQAMDRESYLRMQFFQYMIINNDYAIYNKHNLEVIFPEGAKKPRAIPYDFDYAGIVDQDYAAPSSNLPIDNIRQPFFRGKDATVEEIVTTSLFFLDKEIELLNIIESADYLNKDNKRLMSTDLKRFFKLLKDFDRSKKAFIKESKKKSPSPKIE